MVGTEALAAGVALLAAALLVVAASPRDGPTAAVLALAGAWWFLPAAQTGGPLVRSLAVPLAPVGVAALLHLAIGGPARRTDGRRGRVGVTVLYASAAVVGLARAMLRDPFHDPTCLRDCRDNVLLVSNQPQVVRALDDLWSVLLVAAGLAVALVAGRQLWTMSPVARRLLAPVLGPGVLVGTAVATYATVSARYQPISPDGPEVTAATGVLAATVMVLAAGTTVAAVRARRTRSALAALATDVVGAPAPGSFASALASATGDRDLEVVYPLASGRGYVDADGRATDPAAAPAGRVATSVVRGDDEVAVVVHDAASVDARMLRRELGPASRLAVENERLRAQLLSELAALRSSRARIVETGDAERRRLERNLHDGAQQQLLALVFDLRRTLTAARSAGTEEVAAVLTQAHEAALLAVADLRGLAHGIHPAVLTEGGLEPALATLADAAPVEVDVDLSPADRPPEVVERTVYELAAEAAAVADERGTSVTVQVRRRGDRLITVVEGVAPEPFADLADRVGALGGRITGDGRDLRVELPCG